VLLLSFVNIQAFNSVRRVCIVFTWRRRESLTPSRTPLLRPVSQYPRQTNLSSGAGRGHNKKMDEHRHCHSRMRGSKCIVVDSCRQDVFASFLASVNALCSFYGTRTPSLNWPIRTKPEVERTETWVLLGRVSPLWFCFRSTLRKTYISMARSTLHRQAPPTSHRPCRVSTPLVVLHFFQLFVSYRPVGPSCQLFRGMFADDVTHHPQKNAYFRLPFSRSSQLRFRDCCAPDRGAYSGCGD